jgi:transposase
MEATGVYWRPIWAVLEDEFELMLVNARHVKQVPGRKTDMSDAAWLCQVAEAGLLSANFVPPKPIRALRMLTRYRKTQVAERQREANRLHKALEDTGIKLDCVASDILGVSGRAMLDALVAGTTDPVVLAELGKGRLRAKIPALREALEGRFDALHSLLIGAILAHLDFLGEQIDSLSDAIEEQLVPRSSAPAGTCSRRARPTASSARSSSHAATASRPRGASWHSSSVSATPSRSRRPPRLDPNGLYLQWRRGGAASRTCPDGNRRRG